MRRQERQDGLKGRFRNGEAEKSPECRNEQDLRSTLSTMAREDRKVLIDALRDWLHE
jgi:hypothetical protein